MAGSRRWFEYTDDKGVGYAVQLDESTAETTALGFTAIKQETLTAGRKIVRGHPVQMRYLLLARDDGETVATKKVFVGSLGATAWGATTVNLQTLDWFVTYRHGERQGYIPPVDTGKTDGDQENNAQPVVA